MGTLILVRHGKTVLNSVDHSERLRGWIDVPLDENGLQEALETAERVADHPVEELYCSDLQRARQTAAAIAEATGLPIRPTAALRPWNVGSLAGQQVSTILPILRQLEHDPSLPAPHGESFLAFCDRYAAELNRLLALAAATPNCIVAVTHVRNVLATPTVLAGGDRTRIPVQGGVKTGSLLWVEKRGRKWFAREDATDPIQMAASSELASLAAA